MSGARGTDRFARQRLAAVAVAIAVLLGAGGARAVDPFEIQIYDAGTNEPGQTGIEVHINSVIDGRRDAVAPELPSHGQSHFTAEGAIGITRWWEAGAYLQTALLPDGSFHYAGSKLRTKLAVPAHPASRFGWAVNLELARLPAAYDRDRWGAEIRPIATWSSAGGTLYAAVNPIVDLGLAGASRGEASFEPAATICYVIVNLLSVGVEYYADLGPIGDWSPARDQQHYLYEVINVLRWKRVELNVGVGEGLTEGSNPFVGKMIVGYLGR